MIVDLPLSKFIGEDFDIVERLYREPDESKQTINDLDRILELKPLDTYNPTRPTISSYIWCDELAPIFVDRQICIYTPEYKVFEDLKHEIMSIVEKSGHIAFTVKNNDFVAFPDSINEFMVELFQYNDFSWNDFVIWNDEKSQSDTVMDWRDRVTKSNMYISESSEE